MRAGYRAARTRLAMRVRRAACSRHPEWISRLSRPSRHATRLRPWPPWRAAASRPRTVVSQPDRDDRRGAPTGPAPRSAAARCRWRRRRTHAIWSSGLGAGERGVADLLRDVALDQRVQRQLRERLREARRRPPGTPRAAALKNSAAVIADAQDRRQHRHDDDLRRRGTCSQAPTAVPSALPAPAETPTMPSETAGALPAAAGARAAGTPGRRSGSRRAQRSEALPCSACAPTGRPCAARGASASSSPCAGRADAARRPPAAPCPRPSPSPPCAAARSDRTVPADEDHERAVERPARPERSAARRRPARPHRWPAARRASPASWP